MIDHPNLVRYLHVDSKLCDQATSAYDPRANVVREVKPTIPPLARPELDAQLIAILDAPAAYGETVSAQFARKERELGGVFAALTAVESLAMQRRLEHAQPKDDLAQRFARLVIDRRNRLLAFLADRRRRVGSASCMVSR